ncbi:MAG: alpha/beta fold hydrolase [Nanoarchaeota archaeon]|nr:alpha/beta fold hydrolase [Nanoarchaeota archaeon]MBU1005676.1 alpha/beta fold hydrolase [Nanoarchaeota archaeon]MBU1946899.1 alpha/beta fold hydrolase [Nanoarchaeota archaeon]
MELSLLKEPYINIPVIQHNITEKFSVIYSYLISVNLKITKKTYSQLFLFENDLDEISKLIKSLNQTLERDYNSIVELGQNIYLLEYSKKCDIINCTDISNNSEFVCLGLKKIIDEYENNTFSIEDGLVINESYYIDEEGKIKIIISNESNLYYEEYCINETDNSSSFQKEIPLLKELEEINISDIQVYETIDNELTENLPQCCVYGSCSTCCTEEECKEDPELFPIVFIHGHSLLRKTSPDPLLDGFNKIQYQLQEDGYINAGTIKFDFNESDSKENEWGLSNRPITVKASYYYDYFYSLGSYIYITKSTDNIDTYAIRMNDIINLIKYKTGKPKVNIITHSMGGLVARRYIQIFGEDSVDKLILIASPNKGIDGDVKKFCQVFGEKNECEDLYSDSLLIKKLNSQQNIPKKIKQYTISGKGCKTGLENGDGVITFESSLLENSESFAINGTCTDIFKKSLHSDILDIDRYPQVYEYIKQILKS